MKIFTQEDGYSLVETLVSMAILLAVLVPSAMFLVYLANNVFVKDKAESYRIARNEMELIIATKNDSSYTKSIDDTWWVKRTVDSEESLYHLKVEVFKRDTTAPPSITLETSRLWYEKP